MRFTAYWTGIDVGYFLSFRYSWLLYGCCCLVLLMLLVPLVIGLLLMLLMQATLFMARLALGSLLMVFMASILWALHARRAMVKKAWDGPR